MEKNKMINYYIIALILGVALLFIIVASYKVRKDHEDNLHLVVEKRIKEAARECFLNEECEGKITLEDLYEKDYLNVQIDPVSKENMNSDLCIEFEEKEIRFCEDEEVND